MRLIDAGLLFRAEPGTSRAVLTFAGLLALSNGELLASFRSGSGKDSADEAIELHRSSDGGRSWYGRQRLVCETPFAGAHGTLKLCYLSEAAAGRLIAAAMWVDRETYPGAPLFNPATEGCLPMQILLADSVDGGLSWSPWRQVELPAELGPPSLTSPLLRLADGTLAMSIETNKSYHDDSPWYQRAVLCHSHDGGQSWGPPVTAGQDVSGRIFNWDQRLGLAPDGRIGAFVWTYDSVSRRYLNIQRRLSADGGLSWSPAEDLGFADQAGRPAVLPDGRVVLPWVDRFASHSIRVRLAASIGDAFEPASELVLYSLSGTASQDGGASTGAMLADMGLWTFGLPFAERLPGGEVLVVYYAGSAHTMDIHYARLEV